MHTPELDDLVGAMKLEKETNVDPSSLPLWNAVLTNDHMAVRKLLEDPNVDPHCGFGNEGSALVGMARILGHVETLDTQLASGRYIPIRGLSMMINPAERAALGDQWYSKLLMCTCRVIEYIMKPQEMTLSLQHELRWYPSK